ncbi:MAG: MATE family efflux transporter [Lachnospiraceae bacterium]|jgi:putative MATE family efflux protein|nr:MATE family efflux transporter [Lachnospiraceae bacterium]MCI9399162.1 MATE family efflux transporter [Lachnospiraceae bacterium]MCX4378211.1 MATE family efflux transporter [Lachnospiraceae bacterium]
MEKKAVYSMTEGSPTRLLLKFTLPMLIGNLFQQLYNMVDSIVVGRFVGANALASVGATGSLNFLFFAMSFGIAAGVGVVVSQYFGAGKMDMVEKSIINGMYLLAVVSAVMGLIGIISARWILVVLDTPEIILDDAVVYMRVSCAGILAIAAYNGVASVLRALGDSKTPLYFMVVACFINIGLDLLFVITFQWSVFGVAFATVIAQLVAAAGAFCYALYKIPYFRIQKEHRRVRTDIISRCFTLGLPIALQNSLIAFSCIFLQKVVNGFGENVVAANTALGRIEQLVQQPYSSLGAAITTYTGQNIGAGKIDRVKQGYRVGFWCAVIFSLLMLIPAQFFGDEVIHIFVEDPEVIAIGAKGLSITSFFYFFLGMIYVARSVLNGAGDALYAMINGLMEVIGRVGFAVPLTKLPFIGMWGIFFTTGLTWALTGIVSMHRYYKGKWQFKGID